MKVKRLGIPATDIYTIPSNINPNYMKGIFKPKAISKVRPNGIIRQCFKTIKYGSKSLNTLAPKCYIYKNMEV